MNYRIYIFACALSISMAHGMNKADPYQNRRERITQLLTFVTAQHSEPDIHSFTRLSGDTLVDELVLLVQCIALFPHNDTSDAGANLLRGHIMRCKHLKQMVATQIEKARQIEDRERLERQLVRLPTDPPPPYTALPDNQAPFGSLQQS